MLAERHQRRAGLGSDRTLDQHGVPEWPAQSLEPADEIDRGADGGEIEPVGGADIAPQEFAEMQRCAERQWRLSPRSTLAARRARAC